MIVKFRNGLVKFKKDQAGNPNFLCHDGDKIRLQGDTKNPFVATIAYDKYDYLIEVEHNRLVWDKSDTEGYLYLSMDVLTGEITTGSSPYPVFYTDTEPQNCSYGQHWFDVTSATMKVYQADVWQEVFRVFVGTFKHGNLVQHNIGSQFPSIGESRPQYIISDIFGLPMRNRWENFGVGRMHAFATSKTKDLSKSRTLVRLGDFLVGAKASTNLSGYKLVHLLPNKQVKFSDSTDPENRIIGMVQPSVEKGALVDIKTFGFIQNDMWDWADSEISRPLFSDGSGDFTTIPPRVGSLQQVGFVLSKTQIFLDIKRPIILTLPRTSYAFVPGNIKPSVVISYTKERKFTSGGVIEIDFETVKSDVFSGSGVEIDYTTQYQNLFTPGELTFSYQTNTPNLFTPGADILVAYGYEDTNKFSSGGITLLAFDKYSNNTFSGDFGSVVDFNTQLSKVFEPDRPSSIGFSIMDLYSFRFNRDIPLDSFSTSTINIFEPKNEFSFIFTAVDRTVFIGNMGGLFTYNTVLKNIFGGASTQRISFTTNNSIKKIVCGQTIQLISFSAG